MEGYLIITFSLTCSTSQYLEEACMPDASAMRCHFRPGYYGLPSQKNLQLEKKNHQRSRKKKAVAKTYFDTFTFDILQKTGLLKKSL